MSKKGAAVIILRLCFGVLFLYSAISKLQDPLDFAEAIENYQVFGIWISHWGAVLVPALEVVIALFLLTGIWIRETFMTTLILFVAFDAMIVQAALRGLDISCGCFSSSASGPIDLWKMLENTLLTAASILAVILTFSGPKNNSIRQ